MANSWAHGRLFVIQNEESFTIVTFSMKGDRQSARIGNKAATKLASWLLNQVAVKEESKLWNITEFNVDGPEVREETSPDQEL